MCTGFLLTHRHGLQDCSPPSDVSAQQKGDILLPSANTGHYCSVTPAPPCVNPMSVCVSAAGHMNSLELHPEQQPWLMLATATRHPNHVLEALSFPAFPHFTLNPRPYLTHDPLILACVPMSWLLSRACSHAVTPVRNTS